MVFFFATHADCHNTDGGKRQKCYNITTTIFTVATKMRTFNLRKSGHALCVETMQCWQDRWVFGLGVFLSLCASKKKKQNKKQSSEQRHQKITLNRFCLVTQHKQRQQWQAPAALDEQSLAAVTIVLTCGLSSAFASPDTSTSTDMSHSQHKTTSEKKKTNPSQQRRSTQWWLSPLPKYQNCWSNPLFMCRYTTSADIWCLSILFADSSEKFEKSGSGVQLIQTK